MVHKFKIFALAGALLMAASPAFAQDPMGDMMRGLGDLDPLHVLTPAPAAAPAAKTRAMHRHHMGHHHMMGRHHMGHHHMMGRHHMKKKMMGRKMMGKKMMMKKK